MKFDVVFTEMASETIRVLTRAEAVTALEKIGAVIGRFRLVPERMRERGFANSSRYVGAFGRPISKT